MNKSNYSLIARLLFLSVLLLSNNILMAQDNEDKDEWDITKPLGETREIDFSTNEGTWMSIDVSPSGEWLVFDLLGHIYRLPIDGGKAESLTQESGLAVNIQPAISPDGEHIAFISDRKGQKNLWIMNADGSNAQAVITDLNIQVSMTV